MEGEESVLEGERSVLKGEGSVLEVEKSVLDGKGPVLEDKGSVLEFEGSMLEGREPVVEVEKRRKLVPVFLVCIVVASILCFYLVTNPDDKFGLLAATQYERLDK